MPAHSRPTADRHGYTMIEMLTVLVIVMIIASIAAPSMSSQIMHTKNRRALDLVANDIAFARMAAVREGTQTVVDFSSGTSYTVELQSDPVRVLKRVNLTREYRGVQVSPPTASGQLVFDSRGLLLAESLGPIVVSLGSAADSAFVTAAGRVYRDY